MGLDGVIFDLDGAASEAGMAELRKRLESRGIQIAAASDSFDAAVRQLGLSPAQCAAVGDSPRSALACRGAGVVHIGLLCGGHGANAMRSAGSRIVHRDLFDLVDHLDDALRIASPGPGHLTNSAMESLMREALSVAAEAMGNGEAPIGCVLARGDLSIIARGHNEQNRTQNKTAHAEIVTFARAAGKVPLDARDLIMVSTLEPCVMCTGAAMEAAVDTIVYALAAPADAGTQRVQCPSSPEAQMPRIVGRILWKESRRLFQRFLESNPREDQRRFVEQLLAATSADRSA